MIQLDIPLTVAELLQYLTLEKLERTVRSQGKYYYRFIDGDTTVNCNYDGTVPGISLSVQFTMPCDIVYMRNEHLRYNMSNNVIVKEFRQSKRSEFNRRNTYPLIVDEDEHFQQMVMHDQYFPDVADNKRIIDFSEEIVQDIIAWDSELKINKSKRNVAYWKKYGKYLLKKRT